MAENGVGVETVTMEDFLVKQILLEEEAKEKMLENWGDESSCTFDIGYIKQPVYSCVTCSIGLKKQFGFCFGCSMNCHVEHEVIELFDKHNFKCDCGTPNSGGTCCLSVISNRSENNTENNYTHNFDGKYCFCDKSYNPDEDVMLQCVVCEDWFHEECIKQRTQVPDHTTFKDFICRDCFNRCIFLHQYAYQVGANAQVNHNSPASTDPNVTLVADISTVATTYVGSNAITSPNDHCSSDLSTAAPNKDVIHPRGSEDKCKLTYLLAPSTSTLIDTFWQNNWREQLCTCHLCKQLYSQLSVLYLIEEMDEDNVENNGQDNDTATTTQPLPSSHKRTVSVLDSAENAFLQNPNMNHESKLNVIQGYNDMKEKLKGYLDVFAKTGKTVSKEDIDTFFEDLNTKRRKLG